MHNQKIRHVYFIQNPETESVKIGASINPLKRKRDLERDAGNKLKLLYTYLGGGKSKEKEFHNKFKQYRIKGEWFEYSNELRSFIDKLKEQNIVWIGHKSPRLRAKKRKQISISISNGDYKELKKLSYMHDRSISNLASYFIIKSIQFEGKRRKAIFKKDDYIRGLWIKNKNLKHTLENISFMKLIKYNFNNLFKKIKSIFNNKVYTSK